MARRRAKSSGGWAVWLIAFLALWLVVVVVEFVARHWLTFAVIAALVGGAVAFVRRRVRTARDADLAAARAAAQAEDAARQREVEVQRRAIAEAAEAEERAWREEPMKAGHFSVVMHAAPPERERSIGRFLANLHVFRDVPPDEVFAMIERVQHVAPQRVTEGVAQSDAVRLKIALERLDAKVRITEGVVPGPADGKPRRESIPERVRSEVWRRDGGTCVDCGSRQRLEFDHIVPVSQGGSNTSRNLELRCEPCNRRKAAKI